MVHTHAHAHTFLIKFCHQVPFSADRQTDRKTDRGADRPFDVDV